MAMTLQWRIERTVARIALAGLATVLALLFAAGWLVGAHGFTPASQAAVPVIAAAAAEAPAVESAPVEEPLLLRRNEVVQPAVPRPAARSPRPAARRSVPAWSAPLWPAAVRVASYGSLIRDAAVRHALSPSLVEAVARVESGFNPAAVSRKGARGLLQVLPATARRFGFRGDRLLEPEHNLAAGTAYLAWLLDRYGGNLDFALAAYNAGEGAVDEHGGIPPFRETREYVRRVKAALLRIEPAAGEPAVLGEFPPVVFDQRLEDNWKALGFAAGLAFESAIEPTLADVPFQEPHENCFAAAPIETRTAEADGAPHSGEGHRTLVWRPH
ncbi:MAG TPA: lytic transglycosylase domain-containing protein [Thermoanaerobaculia bacterium]|jgi:soluble lytic murein transglycosylase-like protein